MKTNLSVSVVIVTANRQHVLNRCLSSLYRQSVPLQDIVVVDGSNIHASTQNIVTMWKNRLPIRLLQDKKRSIPYARNLGAQTARGDIIAYLDDDLAAHKDYIVRIRAHFVNDPGLAAVFGRILNARPDNLYASTQYAYYDRGLRQFFPDLKSVEPVTNGRILDCEVMGIRKSVLTGLRFPHRPTGYRHDDVELGIRLIQKGKRIRFDPAINARAIPRCTFASLYRMVLNEGFWDGFIERRYNINLRNSPHPLPCIPWVWRTMHTAGYRYPRAWLFGALLVLYPVTSRLGNAWYKLTHPL